MLLLHHLLRSLHHSLHVRFLTCKHAVWGKRAIWVIWMFLWLLLCLRWVGCTKEEGGRGLEEIITSLSNQKEVVWLVRLPQWILSPEWNNNDPTSGSRWRAKCSRDIQSEYCYNYRWLVQEHTNYAVCSITTCSNIKLQTDKHTRRYANKRKASVHQHYRRQLTFTRIYSRWYFFDLLASALRGFVVVSFTPIILLTILPECF